MDRLKHTPGPWAVAMRPEVDGELMPDGSGGCSYTGRTEYDRDLGVCTKEDLEQGEYDPEPLARPWNEADAHLISAAPDLYAAAVLVEKYLDGTDGLLPADETGDALGRLRAAIARAEGQSPTYHIHTRDCYDDAGPGTGGVSLVCGKIEGVDHD